MNCLPIVERELRVAARKRSTFWLRVAAAVTGILIGAACLCLSLLQGASTTQMGSALFNILIWFSFVAAFCSGLFFTSDCLSEEKREGTLGLLFLTELRGYDVALGKLAATSLRGVYALLAVLPILAVTLLMGGVTGAAFWKSALALLNGLLLSLAAGLLISALCRDSQKALGGTLLLLLLLALGGGIADGIMADLAKRPFQALWCLSSPGYVLICANAWGRSPYWNALLINQLLAWGMLAGACAILPRAWQERKRLGAGKNSGWLYAWKYGSRRRRARLRRRLLERQPLAWLLCRERWQAIALWTVTGVAVLGFGAAVIWNQETEGWILWNYLGKLFVLILYLWAASQACRFLADARRSGLLELLLASPLHEKQIVSGQWRALRRTFGLPLLLLLSVHVGSAVLSQIGFQSLAAKANAAATASLNTLSTNQLSALTNGGNGSVTVAGGGGRVTITTPGNPNWARAATQNPTRALEIATAVAKALIAVLSTLGNLLALVWFGLWMGLTSRTATLATLKTLLFVQVLPWFLITFGAGVLSAVVITRYFSFNNTFLPGDWMLWWPLLSAALGSLATLAKDFAFIVWARRKLHKSLRQQAARDLGAPRLALPPPLPKPAPAPPVLPAPV